MLVVFTRHLSGRVVGFFQVLDGGFVYFDVVFVFFVIRLVAQLLEDLKINGRNLPRELDGDLLGLGRKFV